MNVKNIKRLSLVIVQSASLCLYYSSIYFTLQAEFSISATCMIKILLTRTRSKVKNRRLEKSRTVRGCSWLFLEHYLPALLDSSLSPFYFNNFFETYICPDKNPTCSIWSTPNSNVIAD